MLLSARALGRVELRLDLFTPDTGEPLARFGLRVLFLTSAVTAGVLMVPAVAGLAPFALAMLSSFNNLVVCCVCLVLCLQAFVRRMRELKREELARVSRAIAGDPTALEGSPHAAQLRGSSFLELLAYRREVDAARTSPVDAALAGRVALYAVLPPLSWVAGALVEQLLSRWVST